MPIDKSKLPEEFIVPKGEEKITQKIGDTIRIAREARGVLKQELADALGVDVEFIEAYECATLAVPIYHFLEIAKILNWPQEFDDMQKTLFMD